MSFLSEFKKFALRGSVMDMAIGIVIGASFGKIVSSLVENIIMPITGALTGGVNFTDLKYILKEATLDVPEVSVSYGIFIQNIVDFLIIIFSIFCVIKAINKFKNNSQEAPEEEPKPDENVVLLSEIRDILKNR
ncbi:MAG: large-conductance mechanosensitive channel protein MscL [Campylobacter sp.]|nr:large-conductance mechanosensitive channel protein MscL [Campylobacter sp.]